jgi:hypothetical protein
MPHLIIFSALFLCALMVSCVLTSCQPLVQPFRPETKTEDDVLFPVRDAGGIVVRNVDGLPDAAAPTLVEALIEGLQKREIPAATVESGINRKSLFLDGTARTLSLGGDRLSVTIDWRLTDQDGRIVGRPRTAAQVSRAAWGEAEPKTYAVVAERAVQGIAAAVQDPTAVAVETPTEPEGRRLYLSPVVGAPGNGGPALSRAMSAALRGAKVPLAPELDDRALVIAGAVHVAPPESGRQRVEIVWTVLDPAGKEVAKLTQANAVPAGTLDGDWGELAPLIAQAAVPGIVDMLRRLPPRAEAPATRAGG